METQSDRAAQGDWIVTGLRATGTGPGAWSEAEGKQSL